MQKLMPRPSIGAAGGIVAACLLLAAGCQSSVRTSGDPLSVEIADHENFLAEVCADCPSLGGVETCRAGLGEPIGVEVEACLATLLERDEPAVRPYLECRLRAHRAYFDCARAASCTSSALEACRGTLDEAGGDCASAAGSQAVAVARCLAGQGPPPDPDPPEPGEAFCEIVEEHGPDPILGCLVDSNPASMACVGSTGVDSGLLLNVVLCIIDGECERAACGCVEECLALEGDDSIRAAWPTIDACLADGVDACLPPATMPPVATTELGPPSWSCLGSRVSPAAGPLVRITPRAQSLDGISLPGAPIGVFWGEPTETCTPPFDTCLVTGSAGEVTFEVAADAWFNYTVGPLVHNGTTYLFTASHFADARIQALSAVTSHQVDAIIALRGGTRSPGGGVIAGTFTDCAGSPVEGAVVRVFAGGTEVRQVTSDGTDAFVGYSSLGVPSGAAWTQREGEFIAVNLFGFAGPARIEVWARLDDAGALTRVGCEEARIFSDGVTLLRGLGPTRADAPASCMN